METPFRALSFVTDEPVTKEKLDQLATNYQWINDNTPKGRFVTTSGAYRDVRTVLLCGRVTIRRNAKSDSASAKVRFGRAFAPNSSPHVTTGVVSQGQPKVFCTLNGPGTRPYPNHTGFDLFVNVADPKKKKDKILKMMFIHWQALGWRTDDMREF